MSYVQWNSILNYAKMRIYPIEAWILKEITVLNFGRL